MIRKLVLVASILGCAMSALAQSPAGPVSDGNFKLALPSHPGRLEWQAAGFTVVESSAKSNGNEMGIRGKDSTGKIFFLGFLFLYPEQAPMTSTKCRDGILAEGKKNPRLKVLATSELKRSDEPSVALVDYSVSGTDGKTWHQSRGFVADKDMCGDLEFYSEQPISSNDQSLQAAFGGYRLDTAYVPQFNDVFMYAQILYLHHMYKAAGPIFEEALGKLPDDKSQQTMRRVVTDQPGMSYGIAGDIAKSRAIFEAAIAKDPDYPLYYYNLACADAEEKNLSGAQTHLEEAFARKKNMIAGETFPDPTKDDSFLPYKNNKEFWSFLQSLH